MKLIAWDKKIEAVLLAAKNFKAGDPTAEKTLLTAVGAYQRTLADAKASRNARYCAPPRSFGEALSREFAAQRATARPAPNRRRLRRW